MNMLWSKIAVGLSLAFFVATGSAGAVSLDLQVNASANDAEENSTTMNLTSNPLDLNSQQWVGCRFTNVTIPQGAYIISAYVTFTAQNSDSTAGTVTIYGEATNNSSAFTTSSSNISGRTDTAAAITWSPGSWSTNVAYTTPELRTIMQEIVNRSGWSSGNSLSLLFLKTSGRGRRRAFSYDNSTTKATKLHIEYAVVTRPVANRLLCIVTSTSSPTAQEQARITFFQDIGYTVTLIASTASQASYDSAAAANDVAYVCEDITSGDLNTKLKAKTIGIVNEEPALSDDYAVSSTTNTSSSQTAITITKTNHYITSPFSTGSLTIANTAQGMNQFAGTLAPDLDSLATVSSSPTLVVVESNGKLYDGTTAAGRRVFVPWGSSFGFSEVNDNGLYLCSRALAWAGGLVGYWKLDETSGTSAADSTPTANTGTLNSLSFSSDRVATAKVNGGLNFDGVSDYISVSNSSNLQLTTAMSFSAWIKGDSWGTGSNANVIVRKGDNNPNNYQFAIENGYLALGLDGNDGSNPHNTTSLSTGQWYHVVATWDGTTIRFYINGVANGTSSHSGTISTDTRPFYIGGRSGSTDGFDGVLDDIRFFNYALDTDEIAVLFAQGSTSLGIRILKWEEIK